MSEQNFDLEMKAQVTAKQAPDFKELKLKKALGGLSEKDLIERHTIGQVKDEEAEEPEQSETNL